MADTPERGSHSGRPTRVLFVCTANRVRSPFAEATARSIAASAGLPIEVASAGTEATEGAPALVNMVEVAQKAGVDLSGHRSRPATAELLAGADLVVTMTGQHVLDIVAVDPGASARTVTLRELASGAQRAPVPGWDPDSLAEWLEAVVDRPISALLDAGADVDDPIGGPKRAYRRTATEITELLEIALGSEA